MTVASPEGASTWYEIMIAEFSLTGLGTGMHSSAGLPAGIFTTRSSVC